jgi:hypothetical protein
MKPSAISAVPAFAPAHPRLPQTPRKDDESLFAFAPPPLSPPPPKLVGLVTSTPQPSHTSLPTLTSVRSHSRSSQLSTLTTCDIPMVSNCLAASVSSPSSPFPVSTPPRGPFHANTAQIQTAPPEYPQLNEYLPSFLPYPCRQVVDTIDDPSDPDPVGRIWKQERDILQKERATLPSRVCKLSLLRLSKRVPTIVAQTDTLPNSLIDTGLGVPPKRAEQLWTPSFPDAKTPNHRLVDPCRSQLRRRDFLGSADPMITPQVIAAETASVKGDLPDIEGCPTAASKVKFWIPDIHSSPFSAARSFVTVPPADIHSEAAENLSQNVDITTTRDKQGDIPGHQQSGVLDCACEVTEYPILRGPEPSDAPQVS